MLNEYKKYIRIRTVKIDNVNTTYNILDLDKIKKDKNEMFYDKKDNKDIFRFEISYLKMVGVDVVSEHLIYKDNLLLTIKYKMVDKNIRLEPKYQEIKTNFGMFKDLVYWIYEDSELKIIIFND